MARCVLDHATLAITPNPPVRGAKAKVSITAPTGAFGFKVTDWGYDVSHTNPGMPVSTATVTRPTSESASTFNQEWEGIVCASGKASAKFTVGATVRASGDAAVTKEPKRPKTISKKGGAAAQQLAKRPGQ